MANYILLIPILISFIVVFLVLPYWIKKARQINLLWEDMNKSGAEKVAGSGGIIAVLGFVIGVLLYIAHRVFIISDSTYLIEILALLTVTLILTSIGIIDDLLGWHRGGLSKRSRLILVALAAIPLMAINAGENIISVPFLGTINFGIIYPLIFIPIGITGAATTFNFLAGFNGLESGQGIILLSGLAIVSFFTGSLWLTVISLIMIASLLAFLFFNFCPAKVLPGDSLTYSVGGLIAIISILGNFEKIAVFFFIPCIIETVLKMRGGLSKYSFGEPDKQNNLSLKYDKLYSLNHVAILLLNKTGLKATEKKVVFSIWAFQIIIILLGFIIFKRGIFV